MRAFQDDLRFFIYFDDGEVEYDADSAEEKNKVGEKKYPRISHCLKGLGDLTVSERPGTSYQIEIHFAVVNHLYLLFSFVKLVET